MMANDLCSKGGHSLVDRSTHLSTMYAEDAYISIDRKDTCSCSRGTKGIYSRARGRPFYVRPAATRSALVLQ